MIKKLLSHAKIIASLAVIFGSLAFLTLRTKAECVDDVNTILCTAPVETPTCLPENYSYTWNLTLDTQDDDAYAENVYPVYAALDEGSSLGVTFNPSTRLFNNYDLSSPTTGGAPTSRTVSLSSIINTPSVSAADSPSTANINVHSVYDAYSALQSRWWNNQRVVDLSRTFNIEHINEAPVITNQNSLTSDNDVTVTVYFSDEESNNMNVRFDLSNSANFSTILSTQTYNTDASVIGTSQSHTFADLSADTYYWRAIVTETDSNGACEGTLFEVPAVNESASISDDFEVMEGDDVIPQAHLTFNTCLVPNTTTFRLSFRADYREGQYRVIGQNSGFVLNLGYLEVGQTGGGFSASNTTYVLPGEDIWIKQWYNGVRWQRAGGLPETDIEEHISLGFICERGGDTGYAPSPTPSPTPTPTPTPAPTQQSGQVLGESTTAEQQGRVLGASTLSETGINNTVLVGMSAFMMMTGAGMLAKQVLKTE